MINFIDGLLNKITMYRLVLYFLMLLLGVAFIFGFFGILPYSPLSIAFSSLLLLIISYAANGIFAKFFDAQPNAESAYITALILALIITPVSVRDMNGIFVLIWASILATASKYILAIKKKHIFNPAAFAVAVTGFTIGGSASWWVSGNIPLLPFVVIGGLLVVRKIQRFDLASTFIGAALLSIILVGHSANPLQTLEAALLHTPIFYVASIMLTEPLTTPPKRLLRIAYAAIVGLIYSPMIRVAGIHSTPELALLVGNVFSYIVSPREKYLFPLKEKNIIGKDMYDLIFDTEEKIKFEPGQYMEWTLAHARADGRGNRRYFTIASSPTEPDIHIGVRFNEPSSSFKKRLTSMLPGEKILGGQLAGDFVLPKNPQKKLAFIAGGIGVTPFRSMVKYLSDRNEKRDAILLYSNRTIEEIAYREIFDEAGKKIGLKTVYAITGEIKSGYRGKIDADLVKQEIPDYRERTFYISGTHAMVGAFQKILREMGIPRTQIKIDFFPGFA